MKEEWQGVKITFWLLVLDGVALLTSLVWVFFWPLGILGFELVFPFVDRLSNIPAAPSLLLAPAYGAILLAIAWGLWAKRKWSRMALLCLTGFWIAYAIWDSLTSRPGAYGNPDYYQVDPFVVVTIVFLGIIVSYLFFSKNAGTYFVDN
jgi:hypothetical protein